MIEFLLGVELDCILASHELVRYGATDRRPEPIVNAIYLVDSLFMRHVSLAEHADIFEADEVQSFMHACIVINTEESMCVCAFLPSLNLDENRVL